MPGKKYKLFSAPSDGSKAPCAFFHSDKGCRQGKSCKFSHEIHQNGLQADREDGKSSFISSESEESVVEVGSKEVEIRHSEEIFAPPNEASNKKTRRGRKTGDHPFANPSKHRKIESNNTGVIKAAAHQDVVGAKETDVSIARAKSVLNLKLPISPFSLSPVKSTSMKTTSDTTTCGSIDRLVLPRSTERSRAWLEVVQSTQKHPRFKTDFDFEKMKVGNIKLPVAAPSSWVKTRPATAKEFSSKLPVIAIDCEMCATQDPVSGARNHNALCRISIVDGETRRTLLDTLVRPEWPVIDYRTWVNGIKKEDLENVQFTIRHAQALVLELCHEETVIVGHAVHHDLAAIKLEHTCVADSAFLFKSNEGENKICSLHDIAKAVLRKEMPSVHDSVNDAITAFDCVNHYREKRGCVESIERSKRTERTRQEHAIQLFVHRIPRSVDETHLSILFVSHADITPQEVQPIESGEKYGKTLVLFRSEAHASLAFDCLDGSKPEEDASGRLQKKIFLKNGDYIRVRKMTFERSVKPSP